MSLPEDEPEHGAALLIVMCFGLLSTLVMLAMVGRLVTEQRAVARNFAEIRAYWAALGMNTYVLSRTMQMGDCGSNCGNALLPTQQGYAAEIADLRTWQYPDVGAGYQFSLQPVVSRDASLNMQGMLIRTTFSPLSPSSSFASPEALASMATIRPVEFRYCLVASSASPCASGVTKTPPGYQLITSVHRPMN